MSSPATVIPGDPALPQIDLVRVITDTTELRWFAPGRIPGDVHRWFGAGAVEERCDTYRLDGRDDVGLKLRSGELLELKVRESVGAASLALSDGLCGRLERWRRWSPSDGLVALGPDDHWVDVMKSITKRRFFEGGIEAVVGPHSSSTPFCDIELTAVTIDDVPWWSLAMAVHGAPGTPSTVMRGAWDAVTAAAVPPELAMSLTEQRGYPQWLADRAPRVDAASTLDISAAG